MTKVGTTRTFGRDAQIGSNQIRNLQKAERAKGPQNQQTEGSVDEVGLRPGARTARHQNRHVPAGPMRRGEEARLGRDQHMKDDWKKISAFE